MGSLGTSLLQYLDASLAVGEDQLKSEKWIIFNITLETIQKLFHFSKEAGRVTHIKDILFFLIEVMHQYQIF